MGLGLYSKSQMVVLGVRNATYEGALLVVGNGVDGPPSDALVIKKNGQIIIPTVQGDISMGEFGGN